MLGACGWLTLLGHITQEGTRHHLASYNTDWTKERGQLAGLGAGQSVLGGTEEFSVSLLV